MIKSMKTYYNSLGPKFVGFFSQNKTKQNIFPCEYSCQFLFYIENKT